MPAGGGRGKGSGGEAAESASDSGSDGAQFAWGDEWSGLDEAGQAPAAGVGGGSEGGNREESGAAHPLRQALPVEELGLEQMCQEVMRLRNDLAAAHADIEKSGSQARQLQKELRDVSERQAAAERKVYAMTKERESLLRSMETMRTDRVVAEKEDVIGQLRREGEAMAKQMAGAETAAKKLRAQVAAAEGQQQKLQRALEKERRLVAAAKQEKAELQAAADAQAERSRHEIAALRSQHEEALQNSRTLLAEEKAKEQDHQGLKRRVKDAEARTEVLAATVQELRDALDAQRISAAQREEDLLREVEAMEQRLHEAERRHEELATSVAESSHPLVKQVESLRSTLADQQEASGAALRHLGQRAEEADEKARGAREARVQAETSLQMAQSRLAASQAAAEELREEALASARSARAAHAELQERERLLQHLQAQARHLQESVQMQEQQQRRQQERLTKLNQERAAAEKLATALQAELDKARNNQGGCGREGLGGGPSSGPEGGVGPPAAAAPGFRWVLVKEGAQQPAGGPGEQAESGPGEAAGRRHTAAEGAAVDDEGAAFASGIQDGLALGLHSSPRHRASSRGAELGGVQVAERVPALETELDQVREEALALRERHAAAIELLGEREEQLLELQADLADVKQLYREQIDLMADQIFQLQTRLGNAPAQPSPAAGGAA